MRGFSFLGLLYCAIGALTLSACADAEPSENVGPSEDEEVLLEDEATSQLGGIRYVDPIFSRVKITNDVPYSVQVVDVNGRPMIPKMDIYEPEGDTATDRVAMILMHGGSGCGGSRKAAEMVALAKQYAKRGYVAASIDYRLKVICWPNPDPLGAQAANDAQSDAHAAVRFLHKNDAIYKINDSQVMAAGFSAGATKSFRMAYNAELLGTPKDTNPSNPGYPSTTAAVVGIGFSVPNAVNFVQGERTPMIQFYGANDSYYQQYGRPLRELANSLGIINEWHFYPGAGHYSGVFTSENVKDMANKSGLFIYTHVLN